MIKTNVGSLTGFDLGPLQEELVGTIYKGTEALKKTTAEALGVSKTVLQEAFKFPFGGEDEKKG